MGPIESQLFYVCLGGAHISRHTQKCGLRRDVMGRGPGRVLERVRARPPLQMKTNIRVDLESDFIFWFC